MNFRNALGNTPLDPNELNGLIPFHISNQAELNEWEQTNIAQAELWLFNRIFCTEEILELYFIKKLHYKMFCDTWHWAGKFRKSNKNIGIDWHNISVQLQHLFDDTKCQLEYKVYSLDEIAIRFHHRLVFIHPFVNGNGRMSRVATDIFLTTQNQAKFSWGRDKFTDIEILRKTYIEALQAADRSDYSLLFDFLKEKR